MEAFKKSRKSICYNCINLDESCKTYNVMITCGTDSTTESAKVDSCNFFNKELLKNVSRKGSIVIARKPESRIEMMGGGFEGTKYDIGKE